MAKRPKPEEIVAKLRQADVLSDLFILRGVPTHIRSDNGSEFIAKSIQGCITTVGAETVYTTSVLLGDNGTIESFNAHLRDDLLNCEIFIPSRSSDHH